VSSGQDLVSGLAVEARVDADRQLGVWPLVRLNQ
jgi:hypothetical protein